MLLYVILLGSVNIPALAEVAHDFSTAPAPSEMLQGDGKEALEGVQTEDLESVVEVATQTGAYIIMS